MYMRGRPKKCLTEEARKEGGIVQKSKYMLNKPQFCDIWGNNKNYTLASKTQHMQTLKHLENLFLGIIIF